MFGVDSGELFIIILVAVVVIGPKDLPRVMRTVGHWVGKARGMANQFRSGVDQMMRESEIAELEKKWREQNEAIMRANPLAPPVSDWGLTPPEPAPAAAADEAPVSLAKPVSFDKAQSFDKPVSFDKPGAAGASAAPQTPHAIPPLVAPSYPAPRAPAPGGDAA
jgi:sec-independent protein translocase protein TatB